MTIKDALDRAKQLKQARLQSRPDDIHTDRPQETREVPARNVTAVSERPSQVSFPPLRSVNLSAETCEKHRLLLTDGLRRELPSGDAAFRLLRSRVQQILKRNNWSTLGVVSPEPNAGKTVTTLNLALSIARERQRQVYVIDLDMRNPSVCAYLGLDDVRSIVEFFSGDAEPGDVLMQTSDSHLVVAGAANSTEHASEMLAGRRLEELFAHIRQRSPAAIILVDLPPVNRTDEALVVAPRLDGFLVVVAEGGTERKDLSRALSVLSEFQIAGVVVNRSSEFVAAKYDQYSA